MIKSLDSTLASIGGYSGLIWGIVFFLMADYQKFQLNMSMIQTLYQLTGFTNNPNLEGAGDPVLPTNPDTEVTGAVSSHDKTSK